MKHFRIQAVVASAMLSMTSLSHAAVPSLINFQGRLLDSLGNPVSGVVDVSVCLFATDSGGVATYNETIGEVAVVNGIYAFQFGSDSANLKIALGNPEAWLEVKIDGEPLAPRHRLVAVPFALESGQAASVTTGAIDSDAIADGVITASDLDLPTMQPLGDYLATIVPQYRVGAGAESLAYVNVGTENHYVLHMPLIDSESAANVKDWSLNRWSTKQPGTGGNDESNEGIQLGYNVSEGGGRKEPGDIAWYMQFEANYWPTASTNLAEFHLDILTEAEESYRPVHLEIDKSDPTAKMQWQFLTTRTNWSEPGGSEFGRIGPTDFRWQDQSGVGGGIRIYRSSNGALDSQYISNLNGNSSDSLNFSGFGGCQIPGLLTVSSATPASIYSELNSPSVFFRANDVGFQDPSQVVKLWWDASDPGLTVANDAVIEWCSNPDGRYASGDVGLERDSAGVLEVTNGGSGAGIIKSKGAIYVERPSDPPDPAEGSSVTWQSDGTGYGDAGDIIFKVTSGGITKTVTLIDFSAAIDEEP